MEKQKYKVVLEFTLTEEDESANSEYASDLLNELKKVVMYEGLTKATLEKID